jgi:beta-1,4-mannosyl-glycoprotein beta-1,4-N-acetylglucosaminyltransferase
MKLFDCFMYNNEDLILELRFNTLNKLVDKFIIVESAFDHQGNKKKFNFNIKKFKKFKNKIKYLKLHKFPENFSDWERENYNRNYISKGLIKAKPDDLIMISDIDEIPLISNIEILKKKKFTVFKQKMFYYRFNLQNTTEPYWYGTKVCKKKYLKSPQWLRNQKVKIYPFWRVDKIKWNIVNNGGWHFSFVMNDFMITKKIKSFAHREFNVKKFNSIRLIKNKIQKKKDIFDRKFNFKKIENINELPSFLIKNPKKFKNLMI